MICGRCQSVVYSYASKTDECRLCYSCQDTWRDLETSPRAMLFWKSGFKFAFGRNKKGEVFRILSQLKKLSKSNGVHAQNVFTQYVTSYFR